MKETIFTWGVPAMGAVALLLSCSKHDGSNHDDTKIAPVATIAQPECVKLPVDSVALCGSATGEDGTIASYKWTQPYGPSTAVLSSTTSAHTIAKNLEIGLYVFRLTVTDNEGFWSTTDVNVEVGTCDPSGAGDWDYSDDSE